MDRLDVIIFGVTGYTGKYTVYWATKILKDLRWGVAGRNKVCWFSIFIKILISRATLAVEVDYF